MRLFTIFMIFLKIVYLSKHLKYPNLNHLGKALHPSFQKSCLDLIQTAIFRVNYPINKLSFSSIVTTRIMTIIYYALY